MIKFQKVFVPCEKCKGKGISGKSDGYIYNTADNTLYECQCHKNFAKEEQLFYKMSRAGFDTSDFSMKYKPVLDIRLDAKDTPHYVGSKSRDSVDKIIKFKKLYTSVKPKDNESFDTWQRFHNCMIYVYGPNGTQKTSVINWLAREILSSDSEYNHIKYFTMNDFIKDLVKESSWKAADDNDGSFTDSLLSKIDILVLDESFDKEKVTLFKSGYQIPFLDTFLRKWMSSNKSIIFISNVSPDLIEANGYSASIEDFVTRNISLSKGALLSFEDRYLDSIEAIPEGGLFD